MRLQVHVKVEAFTAGELAVRAQQEGVGKLRPDEAEDTNEARLPVPCSASLSAHCRARVAPDKALYLAGWDGGNGRGGYTFLARARLHLQSAGPAVAGHEKLTVDSIDSTQSPRLPSSDPCLTYCEHTCHPSKLSLILNFGTHENHVTHLSSLNHVRFLVEARKHVLTFSPPEEKGQQLRNQQKREQKSMMMLLQLGRPKKVITGQTANHHA